MTHTTLQEYYFSKYFPRANTSGTLLGTDKLVLRAVLQREWGLSKSNEADCLSATAVQQDSQFVPLRTVQWQLVKANRKININL